MADEIIPFSRLEQADLHVDAIYQSGRRGNAGDEPLPRLISVSNSGGFRYRGNLESLELVALTSSLKDPDWPDLLDPETGIFTYYGDNKRPGRPLHETPRNGNELLRRIFNDTHSGPDGRRKVPPIFIFTSTGEWRDFRFRGLAVPGSISLSSSEDLVAIWKITEGARFQNYRARFTVLNAPIISRTWINDIIEGRPLCPNAPEAWRDWVENGNHRPLQATRSLEYRTKDEQLPTSPEGNAVIRCIHKYFAKDPYGFEHCAAGLVRLMMSDIASMDVTRPSRDGGRDAIGQLRIGTGASAILVEFALEAKCYALTNSVGVRPMSRLISRLRHRQFGILVTTSYVDRQAYQEIKEDQHPIIVIAAADIVVLLKDHGYSDPVSVLAWLKSNYPLDG
ncbi:restriction endonuclease [Hoeflea sp. AS60]|uniref:restriction endonuclease n=1 Tax=Hoeflea sp. AS60 TaxID=3135780 RepID=UPI00317D00D2